MQHIWYPPQRPDFFILVDEPLMKAVKTKPMKLGLGTAGGLPVIAIGPKGGKIVGYTTDRKPIYAGSSKAKKLAAQKKAIPGGYEAQATIIDWLIDLGFPAKKFGTAIAVSEKSAKLITNYFKVTGTPAGHAVSFTVAQLKEHVGKPLTPKPENQLGYAAKMAAGDDEGIFPNLDTLEKLPAGKYAGSHGNLLFQDPQGKKWIFKKEDPTIARAEEAAARIGRLILGEKIPPVKVVEYKGDTGALIGEVEGTPLNESSHSNPPDAALKKYASSIAMHQVVDWLTSNHDGHAGNFLDTGKGLNGIDKGQAWKFFGKDSLTTTYSPNPSKPIYVKFWNMVQEGEISKVMVKKGIEKAIERAKKISTQQFKSIIAPYVSTAAGHVGFDPQKRMKQMLARLENLEADFNNLWQTATGMKDDTLSIKGEDNFETMPESELKDPDTPLVMKEPAKAPVVTEKVAGWPMTKGKITINHPGSTPPDNWPKGYPGPGFTAQMVYKKKTYTVEFQTQPNGKIEVVMAYPDGSVKHWSTPAKASDSMKLFNDGLPMDMSSTEKKKKGIAYPAATAFGLKTFKDELAAASHGGDVPVSVKDVETLEKDGDVVPETKELSVFDMVAKEVDGPIHEPSLMPNHVKEFIQANTQKVPADWEALLAPGQVIKLTGADGKPFFVSAKVGMAGLPEYVMFPDGPMIPGLGFTTLDATIQEQVLSGGLDTIAGWKDFQTLPPDKDPAGSPPPVESVANWETMPNTLLDDTGGIINWLEGYEPGTEFQLPDKWTGKMLETDKYELVSPTNKKKILSTENFAWWADSLGGAQANPAPSEGIKVEMGDTPTSGPLPENTSITMKKKFPWGKSDVLLHVTTSTISGKPVFTAAFFKEDGDMATQEFDSLSAASDWVWVNQKGYANSEDYKAKTGKKKVPSGGGWKFWGVKPGEEPKLTEPPKTIVPKKKTTAEKVAAIEAALATPPKTPTPEGAFQYVDNVGDLANHMDNLPVGTVVEGVDANGPTKFEKTEGEQWKMTYISPASNTESSHHETSTNAAAYLVNDAKDSGVIPKEKTTSSEANWESMPETETTAAAIEWVDSLPVGTTIKWQNDKGEWVTGKRTGPTEYTFTAAGEEFIKNATGMGIMLHIQKNVVALKEGAPFEPLAALFGGKTGAEAPSPSEPGTFQGTPPGIKLFTDDPIKAPGVTMYAVGSVLYIDDGSQSNTYDVYVKQPGGMWTSEGDPTEYNSMKMADAINEADAVYAVDPELAVTTALPSKPTKPGMAYWEGLDLVAGDSKTVAFAPPVTALKDAPEGMLYTAENLEGGQKGTFYSLGNGTWKYSGQNIAESVKGIKTAEETEKLIQNWLDLDAKVAVVVPKAAPLFNLDQYQYSHEAKEPVTKKLEALPVGAVIQAKDSEGDVIWTKKKMADPEFAEPGSWEVTYTLKTGKVTTNHAVEAGIPDTLWGDFKDSKFEPVFQSEAQTIAAPATSEDEPVTLNKYTDDWGPLSEHPNGTVYTYKGPSGEVAVTKKGPDSFFASTTTGSTDTWTADYASDVFIDAGLDDVMVTAPSEPEPSPIDQITKELSSSWGTAFKTKASNKAGHTNIFLKDKDSGKEVLQSIAQSYGLTIKNKFGEPKWMYGNWFITVPNEQLGEPTGDAPKPKPKKVKPPKKELTPEQKAMMEKAQAYATWAKDHAPVNETKALHVLAHYQAIARKATKNKDLRMWAYKKGNKILLGSDAPEWAEFAADLGKDVDTPLGPMKEVTLAALQKAAPKSGTMTGPDGKDYPKGTKFEEEKIETPLKELLSGEPIKIRDHKTDATKATIKISGSSDEHKDKLMEVLKKYDITYTGADNKVGGDAVKGSTNWMVFIDKDILDKPGKVETVVKPKIPKQPEAFSPAPLPFVSSSREIGDQVISNPLVELSMIPAMKMPRHGHTILMGGPGVMRDFQVNVRKVIDKDGKRHVEISGQLAGFNKAKATGMTEGYVPMPSGATYNDPVKKKKTLHHDEDGYIVEEKSGDDIMDIMGVNGKTASGKSTIGVWTDTPTFKGTFKVRIPEGEDVQAELADAFTQMGYDPEQAMAPVTGDSERIFKKFNLVRSWMGAKGWYNAITDPELMHNEEWLDQKMKGLKIAKKLVDSCTIEQTVQGKVSVVVNDDKDEAKFSGIKYLHRVDGNSSGNDGLGSLFFQLSQGVGWGSRKRVFLQGGMPGTPTGGWSGGMDVKSSGGATGNFFRSSHSWTSVSNDHGVVVHPRALKRTDWFMHTGDKYGSIVPNYQGNPESGLSRNKAASYTSSNEVMFEDGCALKDVVAVTVGNETEKAQLISMLEKAGVTEINGEPVGNMILTSAYQVEARMKEWEAKHL